MTAAYQFPVSAEQCEFTTDVLAGLRAMPKRLSPKYFYDQKGAELFEAITEQPEYYPTRTELSILRENAHAITRVFPAGGALVEFGTGSSQKARIVIEAADKLAAYVPVDISPEWLAHEAGSVARDFPRLKVLPVVADFMQEFPLPTAASDMPRIGFFPGSTIGNLEPEEAKAFLGRAAKILGRGAHMIVGVDLVKDTNTLNAAYNDAAGVTAAFNLNLLTRINRELGGTFDLKAFEHHAFFNEDKSRIEMHLASLQRQRVRVAGETIEFRAGATIHTENSYKYSLASFQTLARQAGWAPIQAWTDREAKFSVHALAVN
jgi:dimethylhistidine N-methyltransferase